MTVIFNRRGFLTAFGSAGLAAGMASSAPALARLQRRSLFQRAGKPLGVQLYALGDAAQKDLRGTLKRLAAMGYGDFELPGFYGRPPADLRADADAAGVRFNSIHLNLPGRLPPGSLTLMSSPQQIADALNALGVYDVVLPLPMLPEDFNASPGPGMRPAILAAIDAGGIDMWKRMSDVLNERALALRPFGIQVGYHNHNMEFKPRDGTTGWDVLMRELDPKLVFLELDLGWIAAAGLDPATELRRYKGRVKMVHLKDIKPTTQVNYALAQDPVEVGLGALKWREILPACVAAGVQHYYVEQEAPFTRDRFESMQLSHDFLARFGA
ncbi:sugar phosphate isomerase/epimerase [Sphingobium sp. H39-3-25]|uniref:sugar phosphate isomerase/epimerase family protein n=1 Tax=Sphingobium arseniciresistens TaxID=3030834 RepID=UPI0023B933CE|nr:sugar phosphate isomerase/epimerase [Sphingobium arseniciresistens]